MVEPAGVFEVVDEQVGEAIVVVVDPGAALGASRGLAFHSRLRRRILERAVAAVVVQAVALAFAGDKEVDPAVVVDSRPRRPRSS